MKQQDQAKIIEILKSYKYESKQQLKTKLLDIYKIVSSDIHSTWQAELKIETSLRHQEVINMYKKNFSIEEIEAKMGYCRDGVKMILKKHGLWKNSAKGREFYRSRNIQIFYLRIVENLNYKYLSNVYKLHRTTCWTIVHCLLRFQERNEAKFKEKYFPYLEEALQEILSRKLNELNAET